MADSSAAAAAAAAEAAKDDEIADLLRRLVEYLYAYSDRQKFRSLTALAALAVALLFVWKLMRAPHTPPQRHRRRSTPSSRNANYRSRSSSLASPEMCTTSSDIRAQEAVDRFFQPVNLTLEQMVRHRLNDGRKVTCRLLGVILEETTPEDLQKHASVRTSVVEVLLEITKFCDVYLMERIIDDESGERVLSALSQAGLFTSGGLIKDKVLFCSTENGRASFVRQLEPDWHVDTSLEIIHMLSRFIKHELHISPQRTEGVASNVFSSTSLEQFFGGLDQR